MNGLGLERHEWEGEWEALEEGLRADPASALSELDSLVRRMLEESGYDLTDPVEPEGDEREILAEYLVAQETMVESERGSGSVSPGDVAAAVYGYRAVFEHLIATRASADPAEES